MSQRVLVVLASTLLSLGWLGTSAHADTLLGVYAGAGSWQQDYSGSVTTLDTTLDIEDDLGLSAEANNVFYAALEHPVPLLPNLRAAYADLDTRANVTLIQDVGFAGANFTSATDVSTQLSVAQGDASFYYEMLDNWVSLDLGMTLRYLDGHIEVLSSSQLARADVRGVLPLLYGVVRFDLPLSGFWAGARMQGVSVDGNELVDADLQVGWESPIGLGFEAGWRSYQMDLDSFDDFDMARIDISGPYAALNFHF